MLKTQSTKERRFLSGVKLKTFQFKDKSRKDSFLWGVKLWTFIKIQLRKFCEPDSQRSPASIDYLFQLDQEISRYLVEIDWKLVTRVKMDQEIHYITSRGKNPIDPRKSRIIKCTFSSVRPNCTVKHLLSSVATSERDLFKMPMLSIEFIL